MSSRVSKPASIITAVDQLLVPARTTVYPVIVLILWIPTWALTMQRLPTPIMVDFVARWTGGRMALEGNPNLYDASSQMPYQEELFGGADALSWFVGPPFEAVALAPLGALPFYVAVVLWTGASITCLILALWLLRDRLPVDGLWWRRMLIIAVASKPAMECLFAGQNSTGIMLVVVGCWIALQQDRQVAAGLLLGLGLVKPHLIVLVLILWLVERRWRALLGVAVTGGLLALLGALGAGVSSYGRWIEALTSDLYGGSVVEGQTEKHGGLGGLLTHLLSGIDAPSWLGSALGLAFGVAAILWVARRESDPNTRWWLSLLVAIVCAPHSMIYDLVIALPAVAWALSRWWTAQLRVATALTWVVLWLATVANMFTSFPISALATTLLAAVILRQTGTTPVPQRPQPPARMTGGSPRPSG